MNIINNVYVIFGRVAIDMTRKMNAFNTNDTFDGEDDEYEGGDDSDAMAEGDDADNSGDFLISFSGMREWICRLD